MRNLKFFETLEEYNMALEQGQMDENPSIAYIQETDEVISESVHLDYENPKYFGVIDGDQVTPDILLGLSAIEKPGVSFISDSTHGFGKVLYAYPYEEFLVSIKDQNGFEYLDDFNTGTLEVNGVAYRWYLMADDCKLTNMTFSFD